jgi:hypothetical protein
MKFKKYLIHIYFIVCIIITGCSGGFYNSKNESLIPSKNEPTPSQSSTSVTDSSIKDVGIVITLNNIGFYLDKPLDIDDLNKLSSKDLSILRNAIYAKNGYIFSTKEFSEYFSQLSWYKPTDKNVESKLNNIDKENIKRIISLESNQEVKIINSQDDKNYLGEEKVDISLKDKMEVMHIISENIKASQPNNCPTKITLKIKSSEAVFESLWNDGIKVSITDFDEGDNDIDIYIRTLGTDIGCTTYIYKFDGTKIYKYDEFNHLYGEFLYDRNGNIYYCSNEEIKVKINSYYNYKTKQFGSLKDDTLMAELSKYWQR